MSSTLIQNPAFKLVNPSLLVCAANSTTFNGVAKLSPNPMLQCDFRSALPTIILSCLYPVASCAWIACLDVHYPSLSKRLERVLCAIFAPEIGLIVAVIDWKKSSDLLEIILKNYPDCGWTETHAHFARIGGFHLTNGNGKTFLECVKDGTINLPKVSKHDLLTRTKSEDKLGIVLLVGSFVLHCINRQRYCLPLTELQVMTLAYLSINFFIYFFRWHKPSRIAFPIKLRFKERRHSVKAAKDTSPRPLSLHARLGSKASMLGRIIQSTDFFLIGGSSGAIHCLAWSLKFPTQFPTQVEQDIWQVMSLVMILIGGTTLVVVVNREQVFESLENKGTAGASVGSTFFSIPILVYSSARAIFLILALLQFRALPFAV